VHEAHLFILCYSAPGKGGRARYGMREHFHFCTYFDSKYLARALALHASLVRHCSSFTLWALCLDEASENVLSQLALPSLEIIPLVTLEADDPELSGAKANRSLIEYYFTCTPSLPLHILRRQPTVDLITYLDADLWFFGDPRVVFAELGQKSVGIIPHRFAEAIRDRECFGVYNVGWVSFRRDGPGLECLEYWRSRCLAWCSDTAGPQGFADQKYLDDWPERFKGVSVITQKGANLAPWNVANYRLAGRGGRVFVDEHPLIFYHFHDLHRIDRWLYESGLAAYEATLSAGLRRRVYRPYLKELRRVSERLAAFGLADPLPPGIRSSHASRPRQSLFGDAVRSVRGRLAPGKRRKRTLLLMAGDLVL
jgi:hypothetical protein